MERSDHLQHLDKHLVDQLAQVAREAVRDELSRQARERRRSATLYAASGAAALYAGAALALTVGLVLALGLPGWVAALITAAILAGVAYALRNAARPSAAGYASSAPTGPTAETAAGTAAGPGRAGGAGATAPAGPHGAAGSAPVPPKPPVAPGEAAVRPPRPDVVDPETPHHRA
ncbi:phage holin family protein [Streptomyces sp. NPDC086766]|uniref:phage holin family protein n=1 Tax=Streptomyces sp. NPDC086766 TaxID=3365754 RepID=UPI00382AC535